MRVLISGGGIAGLATAIALRKAGYEPLVLGQARRLGFVGQGIGLGANATKALRLLGAADAVHAVAVATRGWLYQSLADEAPQLEIPIGNRYVTRNISRRTEPTCLTRSSRSSRKATSGWTAGSVPSGRLRPVFG